MRLARHAIGIGASALALLGGFWLVAAPWLIGDQAAVGTGWTGATLTSFWTGVGLIVVAALTMWGYVATLRSELYERVAARPAAGAEAAPGPRATDGALAATPADAAEAPGVPEALGAAASPGADASQSAVPAGAPVVVPASETPPGEAGAAAGEPPSGSPPEPDAAAADEGTGVLDIEKVLLPIATALLADLTSRHRPHAGDAPQGDDRG